MRGERHGRVADHRHARGRVAQGAGHPVADRSDPQPGPGGHAVQRRRPGHARRPCTSRIRARSIPASLAGHPANPDGSFAGQSRSQPGRLTDPSKGWHKLVFDQGGAPSPPVFVSVGIDPPTVEFPRNGAEIDATSTPDPSPVITATGTIPYPEDRVRPPARVRGDRAAGARRGRREDPDPDAAPPQPPGDAPPVRDDLSFPARAATFSTSSRRPIRRLRRTQARDRRALPRVREPRRHADEPHRGRHQAAALPDSRRAGRRSSAAAASRHRPRTSPPPAGRDRSCSARATARTRSRRRASCARCRSRTSTFASAGGSTRRAPTPTATGRWCCRCPWAGTR